MKRENFLRTSCANFINIGMNIIAAEIGNKYDASWWVKLGVCGLVTFSSVALWVYVLEPLLVKVGVFEPSKEETEALNSKLFEAAEAAKGVQLRSALITLENCVRVAPSTDAAPTFEEVKSRFLRLKDSRQIQVDGERVSFFDPIHGELHDPNSAAARSFQWLDSEFKN